MNCPYCNSNNIKVIDSRESKDGRIIRRRRECLNCGKRFSTIETIVKLDLQVRKNSGEVEDFNINKIKDGLMKACKKRPITFEQIENATKQILEELKKTNNDVIDTEVIGEVVRKQLKKLDKIAYLRFSLVYKRYDTINDFFEDMKKEFKFSYS